MKTFFKKAILPLAVFALAIVGAFAVNTSDAQAVALAKTAVEAPENHGNPGDPHFIRVADGAGGYTCFMLPEPKYDLSNCDQPPTMVVCTVFVNETGIPMGLYQVYGGALVSTDPDVWSCEVILYDQRFPPIFGE